ncbi:MarR family winged helix-turn-helix transcriptional regulator [Falsibacillus albus]|uniref:MarR family transcriptional regulator n=1 Tax=Falsibacillus albus TaxID=2478915 RepID=A0A3L7JUT8_9BACI|nr:MarR family winged helix-turn-helix transcriptional regulator [Falsibacillus albus]RLQ94260.1 MarR family transcriptional regulator [Falsibacillus albus]
MQKENPTIKRSVKLLRSFWRVQKNLMHIVQKTAVENGLSVPQYSILMTIAPLKVISQKALREKTFLPKSTLSQAVEGLVQGGWLHRQQMEENRREVQLSLSEMGENFFKTIHQQEGSVHDIFESAMTVFTDIEFEQLLNSHMKIIDFMESQLKEQGDQAND